MVKRTFATIAPGPGINDFRYRPHNLLECCPNFGSCFRGQFMRPSRGLTTTGVIVRHCFVACGLALLATAGQVAAQPEDEIKDQPSQNFRVRNGLQVLYDFASPSGPLVQDRSGVGQPINLRISDPNSVRRSEGALEVRGKTMIRSDKPAKKLIDAVRRSGSISIEAWIRPANTSQDGPARIVTLSKDSNERNFTLGQDKDKFEVRLRTTRTSTNGIPALASPAKSLSTKLTHVIYTHDRGGQTRLFVNGKSVVAKKIGGLPSNWNGSFQLGLANEMTNDRPWAGTFKLVAIYNRILSPAEVGQNFKAGPEGTSAAGELAKADPGQALFENHIAPLFAKRCLECHDSASKQGLLDLSKKAAAIAGGESGRSIIPKNSADSLLWQMVESDEMPKKRDPFTAEEKSLLKKWIDMGATWSLDVIDPAIYAHHGQPGDIFVQRLTVQEYVNTVRAAVGVDISKEARELLPADLRADGFSNTAYNLSVDLKHVDAFSRLAEIIVGRMDAVKFAGRFSRNRKLTDDGMRDLIAKMGRWLLRGPLDEHEVVSYRGISTTVASAGGDFREAVGFVLEAMLQSPRFVYRIESQQGDGTAWPVGQHELASRLSYIIWGGPPDEALYKAVDADNLHGAELDRQIRRMLDYPQAVDRSLQFASDWLNLGRLQNLSPNPKMFPKWDAELAEHMRLETHGYFIHVAWEKNRPLSELLNYQATFATPRLARHYGISPKSTDPNHAPLYDVSKVKGRGGLLTQASVLTVGGDEASMVSRGLFVLHDLLRGIVRDPPPCVDTTPVPTKPGLTQRAIAEARLANAKCGGCHLRFEPLAFGLEKFDGIGEFHDRDEHGNELQEDGEILIPGTAKSISFRTSEELVNLLAGSERIKETITWKVTQFALGRPLGAADAATVADIHHAAQKAGGTYRDTITAVVLSDLVQTSRTVLPPPESRP
jgi:hypothetical protein